jgi:diguanylate cyclase (GGDEF)-like protein
MSLPSLHRHGTGGHDIGARDIGRRRFGWLLTRETAINVLLVGVMIAILWSGIWWHLGQLQRAAMAGAVHDSGNLTHAAAESVDQTITDVDNTLQTMRDLQARDPQRFDIGAWASRVNRTQRVALEFVTFNRDGMLTASSLGPVGTQTDFSNQAFFKAQRASTDDQLFISQPIPGRTPGLWSILFARRITTADGWFSGVIAASADASWLTRLHQALEIGHGSLMLIGTDGVIRAVSIGGHSEFGPGVGQNIGQSSILRAAAKGSEGTISWVSPVDHTDQIISFRRLDRYPLIVAVGLDAADILAPYHEDVHQYEIFGLCLTLLIALAGGLLTSNARRLLLSHQVLQDTVNAVSQGIIMVDRHGRIPIINRRARELLRLSGSIARDDLAISSIARWQIDGGQPESNVVYRQPDSSDLILETHTHALPDGSTVRTYADITEREKTAAAIAHMAHHDGLTDLANRRLLLDRLNAATARAQRDHIPCALLCINLDGFTSVNDLHGHSFGDSILREAARRIARLAGIADTVARLEGDTFCILQTDTRQQGVTEGLVGLVMAALREPFHIDGQDVLLSASIGIALCASDDVSADRLLTNADTALYHAKAVGRDMFEFYDVEMDVETKQRRLLEQDLRTAIENQELNVFYQPIWNSQTRKPKGFEALVRWNHPTRGPISPDVFIPVAEASGLIIPLGQWVMETACQEALRWPGALSVSVNFSPKQFLVTDLADQVLATLTSTGLVANRLSVEITEGVLIENRSRARTIVQALRQHGVRISLDDFGTGYSGLSYLREYPIDTLKIDKSFVRSLVDDAGTQAIVQAILTLASRLNVNVIAEGVETEEQLQWLCAAGCGQVQGFLLGRPMPPQQIVPFLAGLQAPARPVQQQQNAEI